MKDYFDQSIRALQLAGMSKRTQESYTRGLRLLVDFYQKTPDQITEVELEGYFLHLRLMRILAPSGLSTSIVHSEPGSIGETLSSIKPVVTPWERSLSSGRA